MKAAAFDGGCRPSPGFALRVLVSLREPESKEVRAAGDLPIKLQTYAATYARFPNQNCVGERWAAIRVRWPRRGRIPLDFPWKYDRPTSQIPTSSA